MEWVIGTEVAGYLPRRGFATAASPSGTMYVLGGRANNTETGEVSMLNDVWSSPPFHILHAREGIGLLFLCEIIFVLRKHNLKVFSEIMFICMTD